MAYDAVRVDDVYDYFISLEVAEPKGDDSELRARIDSGIIGLLPMPAGRKIERGAKAEPQKSPAEMDWMKD